MGSSFGQFEHAGFDAPKPSHGPCGLSGMILECDGSSASAMSPSTPSLIIFLERMVCVMERKAESRKDFYRA